MFKPCGVAMLHGAILLAGHCIGALFKTPEIMQLTQSVFGTASWDACWHGQSDTYFRLNRCNLYHFIQRATPCRQRRRGIFTTASSPRTGGAGDPAL